jgi:hypothetical protein
VYIRLSVLVEVLSSLDSCSALAWPMPAKLCGGATTVCAA